MNHPLQGGHSLDRIRAELREVGDSWRSALLGAAMGALYVFVSASALSNNRAARRRNARAHRMSMPDGSPFPEQPESSTTH